MFEFDVIQSFNHFSKEPFPALTKIKQWKILSKTSSQYVFAEKPPQSKARVNLKERQGEQDDVGWSWKRGKGTLDRLGKTVQILLIIQECPDALILRFTVKP